MDGLISFGKLYVGFSSTIILHMNSFVFIFPESNILTPPRSLMDLYSETGQYYHNYKLHVESYNIKMVNPLLTNFAEGGLDSKI